MDTTGALTASLLVLITGCCAQNIFPPGPVVGVVGGSVWFHTTINPSTTQIVAVTWSFGTSSTSPTVVSWVSGSESPGQGYAGRVSVNGSTGALQLRGLTAADNGTYAVSIVKTNPPATLTGQVTLNVFEPISSVRVGPKDGQTPELNKTLTLFCEVLGSGTVSSRQWRKDSQTLTPSPSISFSSDNSTVTFHLLQQSDAGTYQCTATNPVSSGTGEYRLELQTQTGGGGGGGGGGGSLSGGAVAGIVIAVLVALGLIAGLVYFLTTRQGSSPRETTNSSVMYENSEGLKDHMMYMNLPAGHQKKAAQPSPAAPESTYTGLQFPDNSTYGNLNRS